MVACTILTLSLTFLDSIVSSHVKNTYDLKDTQIGFFFMVPCVVSTVCAPVISYVFERIKIDRRLAIVIAFFMMGISLILMGPSELLSLPQ
jgi:cyanate permease